MAATAWSDGHRVLYHWQAFNEERLAKTLVTRTIYCSSPSQFNDPWDCKPQFNTAILADPVENERHAQWAVESCRRHSRRSPAELERMRQTLLTDRAFAEKLLRKIPEGLASDIDRRDRVYCPGPDVGNLLMWSHYADNHKGVCLEFSLRNAVMCGALRCEYTREFPPMKAYSEDEADCLRILLAKADVWSYERE